MDASEQLSEQDVRIIAMAEEAGRAIVLAFNKWDLTDEERRKYLDREIDRDLVQVPWAPRVNISAKTGRHVDKLAVALDEALEGWETRVSTGRLNQFLKELAMAHPHPLRGYRRFIERRLREEFGFVGTPIRVTMRIREKRSRR